MANTIIPVTEARPILGDLTETVSKDSYIILTKGGKAKAALVDIEYLNLLEDQLKSVLGQTYITPQTAPLTREFSDQEIEAWKKEDTL